MVNCNRMLVILVIVNDVMMLGAAFCHCVSLKSVKLGSRMQLLITSLLFKGCFLSFVG